MTKLTILKPLIIIILVAIPLWAVYLAQINPKAEQFFYGGSEQEKLVAAQQVEKWLDIEFKKIAFVGEIDPLLCWLKPTLETNTNDKPCATKGELREIISQNQFLLDQYLEQILGNKQILTGTTGLNGARLLFAKIHLLSLEGKVSEALKLWIYDHKYLKESLLNQEKTQDWVNLAIKLVHSGMNISVLKTLLTSDTDLTTDEYTHLLTLFRPYRIKQSHIEKILKFEFEILKQYYPNFQRKKYPFKNLFLGAQLNHLYEIDQYILSESKKTYQNHCSRIEAKIDRPIFNKEKLPSLILYGPFELPYPHRRSVLLFDVFGEHNFRINLLRFVIELKRNKISSSKVQDYIASHPKEATNPLTKEIFTYDERKNTLVLGQNSCSPEDIYSIQYSGEF